MPAKRRMQWVALAAMSCFAVFFFLLFRDSDIDWKNARWNLHIADVSLNTEYAQEFSSQLPIVYMEAANVDVITEHPGAAEGKNIGQTQCLTYVYDHYPKAGLNTLLTIPTQVFDYTRVKIRGRSSSLQPKRPYGIELQDEKGNPVDMKFLSFDAESDYVLHAPYGDKTGIKNYIAFSLAAQLRLNYVPKVQPIELIINQKGTPIEEQDYRGLYLAIEKIKTGSNRVPISRMITEDTLEQQLKTGGGYIIRRDKYDQGTDTTTQLPLSPFSYEIQIVSPKSDEITQEEIDMIYQEWCLYERILYEGTFEELDTYFDVDSFVDIILFNELIDHGESFTGSTYFYRLPGGKLCAGPPWDYDLSMGSYRTYEKGQTEPMYYKSRMERAFLYHPEFVERMLTRWQELRAEGGAFSTENLSALVEQVVQTIGVDAFERNASRYPELFDGHTDIIFDMNYFESWQEEIRFLYDYLLERGEYLDEVFANFNIAELPENE